MNRKKFDLLNQRSFQILHYMDMDIDYSLLDIGNLYFCFLKPNLKRKNFYTS